MLPFNWDFYFMLLAFPPFLLPLKYLLLYLKLLYHPALLNHHPDLVPSGYQHFFLF